MFPEYRSENQIKPGLKFLFAFVDILELKVFAKEILDFFLFIMP